MQEAGEARSRLTAGPASGEASSLQKILGSEMEQGGAAEQRTLAGPSPETPANLHRSLELRRCEEQTHEQEPGWGGQKQGEAGGQDLEPSDNKDACLLPMIWPGVHEPKSQIQIT